jgi:dCMP deaminase
MKNWDLTFLKTALLISEHSTCCRVQVGAVIEKNKRIISIGYNGVRSGETHCSIHFKEYFEKNVWKEGMNRLFKYPTEEHFDKEKAFEKWKYHQDFYEIHGKFSLEKELHAEQNAILFADRDQLKDSTLYCTVSPCISCSKIILVSGIKRVVYHTLYDREIQGLELLKSGGIIIDHIKEV